MYERVELLVTGGIYGHSSTGDIKLRIPYCTDYNTCRQFSSNRIHIHHYHCLYHHYCQTGKLAFKSLEVRSPGGLRKLVSVTIQITYDVYISIKSDYIICFMADTFAC